MFCKCGCGNITDIARRNWKSRGIRKGEHLNFIHGHNQKGKRHSQETIDKMSKAQKGHLPGPSSFKKGHDVPEEWRRKSSEKMKGRPGPNKGKPVGEETKRKLSLTITGTHLSKKRESIGMRGEKHWNWKGGVTAQIDKLRKSDEYKQWRESVYRRDKWTCQRCGRKIKPITAHHIKSFTGFPDLRFEVTNGTTLCRSCHIKEHAEIGVNTRFGANRADGS
jgi:hypothetical protein